VNRPPLDLGQQVRDVDVRSEAIQVSPEPHRGRILIERVRRRELEAIADETYTVAGVDSGLQAAQRLLLLGLELCQALAGVQRAAECDRQLVAIGLPELGREQEPGRVGVAPPDRPKQPSGAHRVPGHEPERQLKARALHAPILVADPGPPRLRHDVGLLVDEALPRRLYAPERGE
jgi:hypothetical protein